MNVTFILLASKYFSMVLKCHVSKFENKKLRKYNFVYGAFRTPPLFEGVLLPKVINKFDASAGNAQCNTTFEAARELRTEGASFCAPDHGTRRRRGGVSRICRSGDRSSVSSDGKTTTLHVSRTNHTSQTCLMAD